MVIIDLPPMPDLPTPGTALAIVREDAPWNPNPEDGELQRQYELLHPKGGRHLLETE